MTDDLRKIHDNLVKQYNDNNETIKALQYHNISLKRQLQDIQLKLLKEKEDES